MALSLLLVPQPAPAELVVTPADTAQVVVEYQRIFEYSDLTSSLADSLYEAGAIRITGLGEPFIVPKEDLLKLSTMTYLTVMQTTHVIPPKGVPHKNGDYDVLVTGIPLGQIICRYASSSEEDAVQTVIDRYANIYFIGRDGYPSFVCTDELQKEILFPRSISNDSLNSGSLKQILMLATNVQYAATREALQTQGYTVINPAQTANYWVKWVVEIHFDERE